MKSLPQVSVATLKARSSKYFEAHGRFCSSHPWEVIVTTVTLTVCILSMSFLNGGKLETLKKPCQKKSPEEEKADTFLMIIVNSLAILYLYNQFSNLRRAGSKYLLGIVALFTIFAGFVFGSGVVYFIDSQATGLNEALPFFLLLIDLSKATALAKFASGSTDRNQVRENIGKGMSLLGPTLSLDTLVEVLIISIGTISGVHQLEVVCYFGCMSLLANYIVFMTFFPAALALILEVCPHNPSNKTWHIDRLAQGMHDQKKPNPVVQRVKLIMALGLVVVHIHSRFLSEVTGVSLSLSSSPSSSLIQSDKSLPSSQEQVTINDYLKWKIFNISVDQLVAISLGLLFLFKYIFYDKQPSGTSSIPLSPTHYPSIDGDITTAYFHKRKITINSVPLTQDGYPKSDVARKGSRKDSGIELMASSLDERRTLVSVGVQTDPCFSVGSNDLFEVDSEDEIEEPVTSYSPPRPVEECLRIFKSEEDGPSKLSDVELVSLVQAKHIPAYKLEQVLGNPERGVVIRRNLISSQIEGFDSFESLPYSGYDYKQILGACCENVIGYMPLPVGVAGPLLLNGRQYYVPMSTTEGCLVASTNRGCSALMKSGGINSHIVGDGMTRGPVIRLPNAAAASSLKLWLDSSDNFPQLVEVFNSTSRYAKLKSVHTAIAGRLVYIRFCADTGDAMGMNMLSKGVEKSLSYLQQCFPEIEVLSLSGNYCTDKKPSAVNWIEGRGKYVVCDAIVPSHIVEKVLKTSVDALIDVNVSKNLVGSAMAGSIGGFNAHAANIVTSIFIATGQDPAQVVGSSNCITLMERGGPSNQDLYISCTMPSLEVGTVGGGTFLHAQSTCLKMLGVNGSTAGVSGENSCQLARVVCATVLAGELSLLSALAAGHLVKSHLTMNRSRVSLPSIAENENSRTE